MINRVSETITAFETDPTTELDVKGLLQLKLSLDDKLSIFKKLDGEILELGDDELWKKRSSRRTPTKIRCTRQ